jgi:hypothetical protein
MSVLPVKPEPLSPLHSMLTKIGRERHAVRLNRIVNDPAVYPWVCGEHTGPLDMTEAVADPNNVLLMGQHGGILFIQLQPGLYESHTQVLKEGRGEWALSMVRACLHWMFTRTDAFEIMTKCPKGNLGARALAKAIGGAYEFTNKNGWFMNGKVIPADIYSLNIQQWMRDAPGLEERGHWFHERLTREYGKLGRQEAPHEDDATHDRYVGAACEMFLGNQAAKSCILYNRWARMAGYAPMELLSMKPVAVDIVDAILVVPESGDFYVASLSGKAAAAH